MLLWVFPFLKYVIQYRYVIWSANAKIPVLPPEGGGSFSPPLDSFLLPEHSNIIM